MPKSKPQQSKKTAKRPRAKPLNRKAAFIRRKRSAAAAVATSPVVASITPDQAPFSQAITAALTPAWFMLTTMMSFQRIGVAMMGGTSRKNEQ
jgi:hypothetical protein